MLSPTKLNRNRLTVADMCLGADIHHAIRYGCSLLVHLKCLRLLFAVMQAG